MIAASNCADHGERLFTAKPLCEAGKHAGVPIRAAKDAGVSAPFFPTGQSILFAKRTGGDEVLVRANILLSRIIINLPTYFYDASHSCDRSSYLFQAAETKAGPAATLLIGRTTEARRAKYRNHKSNPFTSHNGTD